MEDSSLAGQIWPATVSGNRGRGWFSGRGYARPLSRSDGPAAWRRRRRAGRAQGPALRGGTCCGSGKIAGGDGGVAPPTAGYTLTYGYDDGGARGDRDRLEAEGKPRREQPNQPLTRGRVRHGRGREATTGRRPVQRIRGQGEPTGESSACQTP